MRAVRQIGEIPKPVAENGEFAMIDRDRDNWVSVNIPGTLILNYVEADQW